MIANLTPSGTEPVVSAIAIMDTSSVSGNSVALRLTAVMTRNGHRDILGVSRSIVPSSCIGTTKK